MAIFLNARIAMLHLRFINILISCIAIIAEALTPKLATCPACGSVNWMEKNFGTEKIEEDLASEFPNNGLHEWMWMR